MTIRNPQTAWWFGLVVLGCALPAWAAKICIDPGHGGSDPGAVGQGLRESDMNLDISLRARDLFQADGWTIIMTRTSDVYVSLQGRCDIANNNGADRFECSHCNAFNGSAYGTETFCSASYSGPTDYGLRDNIQPEMVAHMGTTNRGGKTADFYVLNNTTMAAILCEVAFIDNAGDAAKLANPAYRQEAARAYLHGTQSHYGISPHDPVTEINPPYTFDNDLQGWTAGNCVNGPWHSNSGGWPGILYVDQTCNDAWVYGPSTNFTGGSNQAMAVRVYWPGGTRDMQIFWTTSSSGWSAANSSDIVTWTASTGWTTVALPLNKSTWINQNITQLRLDFENTSTGQRWHVDSITIITNQGNLTGTVTSASSSAPVSGATVTLAGVGNTTTNGSGVYNFSGVTSGSYTVSVSAASFNPASAGVAITAGATTTQNFALTPSDAEAPTTPTDLDGIALDHDSVQLTWTASTDNVAVTGYDVRRDGNIIGSSATTTYTDNSATEATTYTYDVRAKDAVPNYSGWSAPKQVTTPYAPPSPTIVFSDGFNGNLNNWTQQVQNYDYSETISHGMLPGAGAAYLGGGQSDQMYHTFARPFAQCKAKGYFWDGKGGWKAGVCGWTYRQSLSLREMGGSANFILDNCLASNVGNGNYYYRLLYPGQASAYNSFGTRDANTDCNGAWIEFESTITPGAPGANPAGAITLKVTDRAGTSTTTPNLPAEFFSAGVGRITLGLGVTSANEGYWDDISFEAWPPGAPTMNAATALSDTQIRWNFTAADNNQFGWSVADSGENGVSPEYPNAGWLDHNATAWTEAGLTPNTLYGRKVRGWNGTLNGHYSGTMNARTLSPAPDAGSVAPDTASLCSGNDVTWTAAGGFGAGKVEYYRHVWSQNASYTFTGGEPVWSSGALLTTASAPGAWYLHVQGCNGDDQANGTFTYSVTATDCNVIPTVSGAVSRKTHGGAGTFDIDVAATTAVENRSNGPTQVVVTFSDPIEGLGGLDIADVSVSSGSVIGVSASGAELTVTLSGVPDGSALVMGFPGIVSVGGSTASPSTICFGSLVGDVNGDGATNIFDLVTVRNNLNLSVEAGNFRGDVNADGAINIFDLVSVRNNLNLSVAACP